jgi:hypothetical protein
MSTRGYFIGRNLTDLLKRNTSKVEIVLPSWLDVVTQRRPYVSRVRIVGNSNSDAFEEVDEALPWERAFAQSLEEIVLNILLPHVHIGADKRPYERARIIQASVSGYIIHFQGTGR